MSAESSGGQAVEDGGFRVFQIGQSEYRFRSALAFSRAAIL